MNRKWLPAVLAPVMALLLASPGANAQTQSEEDDVIAGAKLVVGTFSNPDDYVTDVRKLVHDAKAVVIFPNLVKAGFLIAGAGGTGVLIARQPDGSWGYPAFYNLGALSVGFQAGIQVSKLVLIINTDKALQALLANEFKFGAEAGLALAVIGGGVEGSVTTAVGADIVAMANSKGLFGGIALQGAILHPYDSWNQTYYGKPVAATDIVVNHGAMNPRADQLRDALKAQ